MTLVDFKLSPQRFLEIVKKSAENSKHITIPDPPDAGQWERTVNYRQVVLCLEEGELTTDPMLDAHGNWQGTLCRFSAGVVVFVTVALARKSDDWHIYVTEVKHE